MKLTEYLSADLGAGTPFVVFDARCPHCGVLVTSRKFHEATATPESLKAAGLHDSLVMYLHLATAHPTEGR
jgi:hypothetical protein